MLENIIMTVIIIPIVVKPGRIVTDVKAVHP
jgi:hypothetical protein